MPRKKRTASVVRPQASIPAYSLLESAGFEGAASIALEISKRQNQVLRRIRDICERRAYDLDFIQLTRSLVGLGPDKKLASIYNTRLRVAASKLSKAHATELAAITSIWKMGKRREAIAQMKKFLRDFTGE